MANRQGPTAGRPVYKGHFGDFFSNPLDSARPAVGPYRTDFLSRLQKLRTGYGTRNNGTSFRPFIVGANNADAHGGMRVKREAGEGRPGDRPAKL